MRKKTALHRFIELTDTIRDLSNPQIRDIQNADDYSLELQKNFRQIGGLSKENNRLLEEHYDPMINSDGLLTPEEVEEAWAFSEELGNAFSVNWIDAVIVYLQRLRLLEDARRKGDDNLLIRMLDGFIQASYSVLYITIRFNEVSDISARIRDKGMEAGYEQMGFLDKEKFSRLSDESKDIVLTDARYIRALFERDDEPVEEDINEEEMRILRKALKLEADPFYREQLPGYDWRYHEYRTLDYLSTLTEKNNNRGFSDRHLQEIHEATGRLIRLWESDPAFFGKRDSRRDLELARLRNAYLAGETDIPSYRSALLELEKQHKEDDFTALNSLITTLVPLEYILTLDRAHLTQQECDYLNDFYNRLVMRMHRMPKKGTMSFLLTYLKSLLDAFIEVPGGMTFEKFGLHLMAALHPPTYVHSLSVAAIAECLVRHLLARSPGLFTDMEGFASARDVERNGETIADLTYHAALCHDFGKLSIIDIIMTYGRNLRDIEFEMIRTHPEVGALLLERHPSTARYASVARGHHRFFDDSGGYPESFRTATDPDRTVIAVVACADCLDAATDSIGRSYKEGKQLERYLREVREGSGTRYAPYLDELLRDEGVVRELTYLISGGRDENYRKTYRILKQHEGANTL